VTVNVGVGLVVAVGLGVGVAVGLALKVGVWVGVAVGGKKSQLLLSPESSEPEPNALRISAFTLAESCTSR